MTEQSPAGGMTDTASTPIPCPWCGEVPRVEDHGFGWLVICSGTDSCPIRPNTRMCASREEAIRLWNTRSPDPLKEALLEVQDILGEFYSIKTKSGGSRLPIELERYAGWFSCMGRTIKQALATTDKGPDSGGSIDPAKS